MKGKTWVHIAPNVAVEIEYDRLDYEQGDPELEGRMTGRVRMTRKAVSDGMFTDEITDEPEAGAP